MEPISVFILAVEILYVLYVLIRTGARTQVRMALERHCEDWRGWEARADTRLRMRFVGMTMRRRRYGGEGDVLYSTLQHVTGWTGGGSQLGLCPSDPRNGEWELQTAANELARAEKTGSPRA